MAKVAVYSKVEVMLLFIPCLLPLCVGDLILQCSSLYPFSIAVILLRIFLPPYGCKNI